jgi:hypothetical protein
MYCVSSEDADHMMQTSTMKNKPRRYARETGPPDDMFSLSVSLRACFGVFAVAFYS